MADRTLLGIVGSVSADSRARTAVEAALNAAADDRGVETAILHIADYTLATGSRRSARPPSSWRPQSTSRRHSGRSGPWSELEAVVR